MSHDNSSKFRVNKKHSPNEQAEKNHRAKNPFLKAVVNQQNASFSFKNQSIPVLSDRSVLNRTTVAQSVQKEEASVIESLESQFGSRNARKEEKKTVIFTKT